MLELQVLLVVSGVRESLAGPSLLDAPGLLMELSPTLPPSSTSKSERQIAKTTSDRRLIQV